MVSYQARGNAKSAISTIENLKFAGLSAWEIFELITSVWYGKQYYFQDSHGLVYSRLSRKDMTEDEAFEEFMQSIGED